MQAPKNKKECLHSLCKWQNAKNGAYIAYASTETKEVIFILKMGAGVRDVFPPPMCVELIWSCCASRLGGLTVWGFLAIEKSGAVCLC